MEEWLRSIGLGERIAAFRAQSVAADQLGELTEDDLRELGLTIGERKRFRRALADQGGRLPESSRAERRPLTMMFVDMVGSSRISELLDEEDQMQLLQDYRAFCGGIIERFGGHIARVVGDGVLAYFCYPVANENDPERAVRAGLHIAREAGAAVRSPAPGPVAVRIGIATGRVIVGDLFAGSRETDRNSIVGATPNLAARLQSLAPPGGVVVADETHARVRHLFACADLGARPMHGFDATHRAWQVTGDLPPHARTFLRPRPRRLTPFLGRGPEQARLAERWEGARQGQGGAALLIGEAGIGKSRLVEDFLARALPEGGGAVQLAASAFDQDSALHPATAFLRAASGVAADDPADVKRTKLASVMFGRVAEDLPVLARLLDIPPPPDAPEEPLTPEQLRERTLSVLTDQMCARAARRPLCVVIEDLHWLDPTSAELLARLVERAASLPMLVLATARDGFDAPWLAAPQTSVLRLQRLGAEAVAGMVASLFAGRDAPPDAARLIASRTDGVPLFVEEVARSLLGRAAADAGEADMTIPASLHEALMARLDRTGAAKEVAQVAAVVGRTVRRALLAEVAGVAAADVDEALAALVGSGVLLRDEAGGPESFSFGHALMRDAAYDTLLRDHRRALHHAVARALPRLEPEAAERQPELLALHLTEGGEAEEAVGHWEEAAKRALSRSALSEATRLLRRGLGGLAALEASSERMRLRLRLDTLLGPALISLHGSGSPEASRHYVEALSVCEGLGDHPTHFPIFWGSWLTAPEPRAKRERARTLLRRAQAFASPGLLLEAHHCNWASAFLTGDFQDCHIHYSTGLDIYHSGGDLTDQVHAFRNHDVKVCAHVTGAHVAWMRGELGSCEEHAAASREWARRSGDAGSHVYAWLEGEMVRAMWRRDADLVLWHAENVARVAEERSLKEDQAHALMFHGWAVAMTSDVRSGLNILVDAQERLREMAMPGDEAVYGCVRAQVLALLGENAQAEELLAAEASRCIGMGLRLWLPELLRTQAEMMISQGAHRHDEAMQVLQAAESVAREQDARMFLLRTVLSAARINAGRDDPARAAARVRTALRGLPVEADEPDIALAIRSISYWERGLNHGALLSRW